MQRKKEIKWSRSVPLKRPDSIISSEYATYVPIKPSYENVKIWNKPRTRKEEVSMFKLLAMDYAREWQNEKKRMKEVIVVSNEAAFLQRRYVIRGLLRKLHQASQPEKRFIMKKFKNVPSRIKGHMVDKNQPLKEKEVEKHAKDSVLLSPSTSKLNLLDDKTAKQPYEKKRKVSDDDGGGEATSVKDTSVTKIRSTHSSIGKHEGISCTCQCTCVCKSFRNGNGTKRRKLMENNKGDNKSTNSSILAEYKSVSRESLGDNVNPDSGMECKKK